MTYAPSLDADGEKGTGAGSGGDSGLVSVDEETSRDEGGCLSRSTESRFAPIDGKDALRHFHQALLRLANGEGKDTKVRVLAYGASHTQADIYTSYLRLYLQERFGDGGQGYVALGAINGWYRTLDSTVRTQGLSRRYARYRLDVTDEPSGSSGRLLQGESLEPSQRCSPPMIRPARASLSNTSRSLAGGGFTVYVDDGAVGSVSTHSEKLALGQYAFEAEPGRRRIRVQLDGGGDIVRLFGLVAETDAPGVVVDTLGIGGSRLTDAERWHAELWIEALKSRQPDLVTFAYGANESVDVPFSIERYERDAREVMRRFRVAAPEASCVFVSPFELAEYKLGREVTRPSLLAIIAAQQRIAREFGCGFWDGYGFMGGQGSMRRWATAKPPLAKNDGIHLTRLGYV